MYVHVWTYARTYVLTARPMKTKSHKGPQIILSPEAQRESFVNSAKTGIISTNIEYS